VRAVERHELDRAMPLHRGERLDHARGAVVALREERRRLEQLGFELPLARCHEQLRYWEFVSRLLSLPASPRSATR
jgi:hypothetical protein